MFKCKECHEVVKWEEKHKHVDYHEDANIMTLFEPIYSRCAHCKKEKSLLLSKGYVCQNCSHVTKPYILIEGGK